jgi:hypothetical protein
VGDAVDVEECALPSGRCCAAVAGYSVHAGVSVPARDRMRLERLARYAGRPPLASERLSLLPDGSLLYRLKHRWRDGTTHVIYESLELIERLAARAPAEVQPHKIFRGARAGIGLPASDSSSGGGPIGSASCMLPWRSRERENRCRRGE